MLLLPFLPSIETDPEGLRDYLVFQHPLEGRTLFRDVHQLPPAHTLVVENGAIQVKKYWEVFYERDFVRIDTPILTGSIGEAASTGAGRLDDQIMVAAVASVDQWQHEVVEPVRSVRRRLEAELTHVDPKMASELKIEIGAAELHAESVEQDILEKLIAPEQARRSNSAAQMEDAQYNLQRYLKLLGVELKDDALESLSTIVAGCCAKL